MAVSCIKRPGTNECVVTVNVSQLASLTMPTKGMMKRDRWDLQFTLRIKAHNLFECREENYCMYHPTLERLVTSFNQRLSYRNPLVKLLEDIFRHPEKSQIKTNFLSFHQVLLIEDDAENKKCL
jgi:hypothetical protein